MRGIITLSCTRVNVINSNEALVWCCFDNRTKPASLELLIKVTQLKTSKHETMHDIDVAVIPSGLTPPVQPLDVSSNRPFKRQMRHLWEQWIIHGVPGEDVCRCVWPRSAMPTPRNQTRIRGIMPPCRYRQHSSAATTKMILKYFNYDTI